MKRILFRVPVVGVILLFLAGCLGTSYTDGETVSGNIPLDVIYEAGDINAGGVEFVIDGDISLGTDTEPPYVMDWDTTQAVNGPHEVTYEATNVAGEPTSFSFTLDVQNAIDTPVPGTVCLVGDSITFQSFYPWGETGQAPSLLSTSSGLGWTVDNVEGWVAERVALRDCQTSVTAMAMNDVNPTHHGGFTVEDQDNFTGIWNTPRPSACKVQVLPFWGSGLGMITPEDNATDPEASLAAEQAHVDALTAFRDWALQQDALREDLVTIDWQPFVNANPWVMHTDGIHLAWADYPKEDGTVLHTTMLEAAEIRQNFYWSETSTACAEFIQQFEAAPELLVADPEQFAVAAG